MQKQRFLATNIRSKELENRKEFQGGIIVNLTNRTSQILLFNGLYWKICYWSHGIPIKLEILE